MVFTALQPLTACSEFGLSDRDKDNPENNLQTETPNNPIQDPLNEEAIAVNPEYSGFQLVEFDSCAKTEAHLKDMALSQLELEKSWEIDHTTRLHNGEDDYIFETQDMVMNESARTSSDMGSAESAAGDQAGPENHTETNNQVKGVGEADFIKNTGTHMFQIEGNMVHITKTWPADSMSVEASIKLKNQPYKLLLNENRLIVLGHPIYDLRYYDDILGKQDDNILVDAMSDIAVEEPLDPVTGRRYINYDRQRTAVTVYDISTISSPQQVYSYDVAGQVREARRVGSLVRLVSSTHGYHTMPQMTWLKWETKRDKLISLGTKLAAIESYYNLNKEKIEKMTLSNFIRARQLSRVSGNPAPKQISDEMCKKIFSVNAKVNNGVTNVVNIDSETGAMDESLLLAAVNTTYMNAQSLYLVTPHYTRWHVKPGKNTSFVHKFDLKAGVKAAYQGSGEVDGNPLNQFALDEHNDILRIATTVTDWNNRDELIGFGRANTYNTGI